MKYESGLSFGRNATIISEAYAKMQSSANRRNRMISEDAKDDDAKRGSANEEPMDISTGNDDFIFSTSKYDRLKPRYPDWLRNAAKQAGYELEDDVETDDDAEERTNARAETTADDAEDDGGDEGSPAENLWAAVIDAHPEEFNEEHYDMEELPKHKDEFFDKWNERYASCYNDLIAARQALEDIPGCECKDAYEPEDDSVGDIDYEGETDVFAGDGGEDGEGFSVVVKTYVRDPESAHTRYIAKYITPEEFKGTDFSTLEEAKDALRGHMEGLKDDYDVSVGVIVNNAAPTHGDDSSSSTVYRISSSNKEKTDRMMSYETDAWGEEGGGDVEDCDEYLQEESND